MLLRFEMQQQMRASRAQVLANYFDLEHVAIHEAMLDAKVLIDTRDVAAFQIDTRLFGFLLKSVYTFQFSGPSELTQLVKTPFGPLRIDSVFTEHDSGTPDVHTVIDIVVQLDLPAPLWPLRGALKAAMLRSREQILREDAPLVERRQKLYGAYIDDYLRDGLQILFREQMREHFGSK